MPISAICTWLETATGDCLTKRQRTRKRHLSRTGKVAPENTPVPSDLGSSAPASRQTCRQSTGAGLQQAPCGISPIPPPSRKSEPTTSQDDRPALSGDSVRIARKSIPTTLCQSGSLNRQAPHPSRKRMRWGRLNETRPGTPGQHQTKMRWPAPGNRQRGPWSSPVRLCTNAAARPATDASQKETGGADPLPFQ